MKKIMNKLKEKASYVKGLMEGLGLDEDKKETRLFGAIIDLLNDVADGVCNLDQDIEDICEEMDAMDEDIAGLEDEVYGDECCGDSEKCNCKEGCDCGCDCDCDEDTENDIFYEVTCPSCNQKMRLDEKTLTQEKTNCLNCGELLEFDLEDTCNCHCDSDSNI